VLARARRWFKADRWLPVACLLPLALAACGTLEAGSPGLQEELAPAVNGYLSMFVVEPVHDGQVFCASETLGVERTGNAIKAWVWALCEELYPEQGVLQPGAGFSGPVMVYLLSNTERYLPSSGDQYMATGMARPRDGSLMAGDIQRMFPAEAIERMCPDDAACARARVERLQAELAVGAQSELGLPLATAAPD